ncbi:DUF3898 domain-containing protein, partial [Microbacteriaceae bacterium K1510]|nr:DUF3898 domain-containing protein [Microbacteriaceae bacterium K1510]
EGLQFEKGVSPVEFLKPKNLQEIVEEIPSAKLSRRQATIRLGEKTAHRGRQNLRVGLVQGGYDVDKRFAASAPLSAAQGN